MGGCRQARSPAFQAWPRRWRCRRRTPGYRTGCRRSRRAGGAHAGAARHRLANFGARSVTDWLWPGQRRAIPSGTSPAREQANVESELASPGVDVLFRRSEQIGQDVARPEVAVRLRRTGCAGCAGCCRCRARRAPRFAPGVPQTKVAIGAALERGRILGNPAPRTTSARPGNSPVQIALAWILRQNNVCGPAIRPVSSSCRTNLTSGMDLGQCCRGLF